MNLSNLVKLKGTEKSKKRLGRGIGSGKGGHTVGRGTKGQKARKGNKKPWLGFEGGQVPLYKRMPRINKFKKGKVFKPIAISLSIFNKFEDKTKVTPELLMKQGIIAVPTKAGVKIIGGGKLDKKLALIGFSYSESAKKAVDKSGSTISAR
jgi:large subunit ribosomal protein L15